MVTLKSKSSKTGYRFRHRHRDVHATSSYVKYEKRCKETERCVDEVNISKR